MRSPDRLHDGLGVLGEPGVVVTGQVRCNDVVTLVRELGNDQVPVPGVRAGAVDQGVGADRFHPFRLAWVETPKRGRTHRSVDATSGDAPACLTRARTRSEP